MEFNDLKFSTTICGCRIQEAVLFLILVLNNGFFEQMKKIFIVLSRFKDFPLQFIKLFYPSASIMFNYVSLEDI